MSAPFHFRQFSIRQEGVAHPVGTDSVLLGAWAPIENADNILDVGTGAGIIALMAAQRSAHFNPQPTIFAIEPDEISARCAESNFAASPWANRLNLELSTLQNWENSTCPTFDLILCNPPFFLATTAPPDDRRRAARNALAALPPTEMASAVLRLLSPNGRFCVVLPCEEARKLIEIATTDGLYCTRETHVRSRADKNVERILLQFERNPMHFQLDFLTLTETDGHKTRAWKEMTEGFYW